jgi:hypothetical protein
MKIRASLAEMAKEHERTSSRQPIIDPRVFADGFVPALLAALYVDAITW